MFYIRYLVSSDIFDIENRFRCCDTFKFACEPLSIVGGHEPKFEKKKIPRSSNMSSRVFRKIFLIVFGCKWCAALSSVFFSGAPYGQSLWRPIVQVCSAKISSTQQGCCSRCGSSAASRICGSAALWHMHRKRNSELLMSSRVFDQ